VFEELNHEIESKRAGYSKARVTLRQLEKDYVKSLLSIFQLKVHVSDGLNQTTLQNLSLSPIEVIGRKYELKWYELEPLLTEYFTESKQNSQSCIQLASSIVLLLYTKLKINIPFIPVWLDGELYVRSSIGDRSWSV
jgi:hypothetical protein